MRKHKRSKRKIIHPVQATSLQQPQDVVLEDCKSEPTVEVPTFMKHVKVTYGHNSEINPIGHKDYNDYVKYTEKKQEMLGFDAEYLDIVDYVMRATHRAWEERAIGVIYDCYHNDIKMHLNTQTIMGMGDMIADTLSTLYSFPDRRVIGEAVIWGRETDNVFFGCHRILTTATNLNASQYGPATGKKVAYRTLSDCLISENRIYEEWLACDSLAIVLQLGLDPFAVAKNMAANSPKTKLQGNPETMDGQYMPQHYPAQDDSLGEFFKEILNDIFNCKLLNRITDLYADNGVVYTVGGEKLIGHSEIQSSFINLLSAFPSARYTIDRITCNEWEDGTNEVAVRWNLRGLHLGLSDFGPATGKPVTILGISNYIMQNGKCVESYEIYDALDVMCQLAQ